MLKRSPIKRKPRRSGPMPTEVRDEVLARDLDCVAHRMGFALDVPCWGPLHVHHKRLRSQGGLNHPDNLITLCETHHRHAHDVDRRGAELAGLIVRGAA